MFHVRQKNSGDVGETIPRHMRKLEKLSALQEKPLLQTIGYLVILDDIDVPVMVHFAIWTKASCQNEISGGVYLVTDC